MSKTDTGRGSTFRFVMLLTIAVAAVFVAVYLLLLADLQRTVNRRLADLRAAGIPTDWKEVIPPPIPDQDNAAILYEQAFDRLDIGSPATDLLRSFVLDDPRGSRQRLRQQIAEMIARNRATLDLIAQAAARARCCFPLKGDPTAPSEPKAPWGVVRPELAYLRQCGRLLTADALVSTSQGKTREALESCRVGIKTAAHTSSERGVIALFVSYSIHRLVLEAMQETLQSGHIDLATCRLLFEELRQPDFHRAYRKALVADASEMVWVLEAVRRRPADAKVAVNVYSPGEPHPTFVAVYATPFAKLVHLGEEIAYIDVVQRNLALAERPYRESAGADSSVAGEPYAMPSYCLMTEGPVRTLGMAPVTRDIAIARAGAIRIALALEAYHGKHDAYPETLEALRDYPGWQLPEDPFSGQDFQYRREGEGFVLYSWAGDLDDDGGRAAPYPGSIPPRDGDMVWKFER